MVEKVHLHERHTPYKPNQFTLRVDPMAKNGHISNNTIVAVAKSNWYRYTLKCEHEVYSKIRILVGSEYSFREHYIRCPVAKHEPLEWQAITKMEAVSNGTVSDVRSGTSFILPNRLLRIDGHRNDGSVYPSGNPFPYVSGKREYW